MRKTEGRVVAARLSEAVAGSKKRGREQGGRGKQIAIFGIDVYTLLLARTLRLHTLDLTWKYICICMLQLPTSSFLLPPNRSINQSVFIYFIYSCLNFIFIYLFI